MAGGIGLMSSLLGIGGGLGVVLAGPIVNHLSYHWLFWFPLIATLIATVATLLWIPESPVQVPGRVNWRRGADVARARRCCCSRSARRRPGAGSSLRVSALFAAGGVFLALWVRTELRADEPLVDMRMMRIRGVWTTNLVAFLLGVGMYSSFVLVPQFVAGADESTGYGFGASIVASGLYLLPSTLAMVVAGSAGRAAWSGASARSALLTRRHRACAARSRSGAGSRDRAVADLPRGDADGHRHRPRVRGDRQPDRRERTPEQTGVATGMNTVTRTLGGALGGQIAATFLAQFTGFADRPTDHAFTLAFGMCTIALIAALVACRADPRPPRARRRRGRAEPRRRRASAASRERRGLGGLAERSGERPQARRRRSPVPASAHMSSSASPGSNAGR